jgi:hypothetical protein
VYFEFRNKTEINEISMCNAKFHPPKCRGKVQKIGVLYTHFPKNPYPFLITPKQNLKKVKKLEKRRCNVQFVRLQAAVARQPRAGALK